MSLMDAVSTTKPVHSAGEDVAAAAEQKEHPHDNHVNYEPRAFSDFVLTIGDTASSSSVTTFHLHRSILAHRSKYFLALLESNESTAHLPLSLSIPLHSLHSFFTVLYSPEREIVLPATPSAPVAVGLELDCKDNEDIWCRGTILEINEASYLIHYNGWPAKWDEWISVTSDRLDKTTRSKLDFLRDIAQLAHYFEVPAVTAACDRAFVALLSASVAFNFEALWLTAVNYGLALLASRTIHQVVARLKTPPHKCMVEVKRKDHFVEVNLLDEITLPQMRELLLAIVKS